MIVLGRIADPFSIQGWVKVHAFGDDPVSWRTMPQWWLCADPDAPESAWQPYRLRGCKAHGRGIVAAFVGVADRTAAEKLVGLYIAAPREALPATGLDEYYWADLVGLAVQNTAGVALGSVSGLLSTGAHDVLQVQDGDTERLIPFVGAYVLDVNLAEKRIRVDWEADW
ncbi:ribosome maturation factor RimM [Niveibacterium sp.]|uniref:ribosome maturation factor RimM n=1 Tax=Niveibacterium sp. TaxID=2017444 RepID=UPI0035AEA8C7